MRQDATFDMAFSHDCKVIRRIESDSSAIDVVARWRTFRDFRRSLTLSLKKQTLELDMQTAALSAFCNFIRSATNGS
jgi:hypothetical protein